MSSDRLSSYPYVVVRVACRFCDRKGSYRLVRLAAKFGPDVTMDELLDALAFASAEEAGREGMNLAYALAKGKPPAQYISVRVRNDQPEPLLTVRLSTEVLKRV